MSQPEILAEIRSARVVAPDRLRERILAIPAASPPTSPRRLRRPRISRRSLMVLAPACLALGLAGALAAGLATSGKPGAKDAAGEVASPALAGATDTAEPPQAKAAVPGALPATPGRAQLYEAELTLQVADLSTTTKRALRLTRSLKGYVRSVEYGSGPERGTASLVLRVPVERVQAAIVAFSALGRILDQHVSIQDVQPQLDRRFRQMQAQRTAITKLQAKLASPALSPGDRDALEAQLAAARRRLAELQSAQAAQQRQTAYATVSLSLRSEQAAAAAPAGRGRIDRALRRSGSILLDEARVLVYVLVVGAPLFLLGGLAIGSLRIRRRRSEERLLSTS